VKRLTKPSLTVRPEYDYEKEVEDAIANVADLNDYKMAMIKFMDNKINIADGMIMRLREKTSCHSKPKYFTITGTLHLSTT
jgi:hypothetical protein